LPFFSMGEPGSLALTNERIAVILNDEDVDTAQV
jgi:hypothetical protein